MPGAEPSLVTYLLPIRGVGPGAAFEELSVYLEWLSWRCRVLIVDGSDPELFALHARRWSSFAAHVAPDEADRCLNGKAWGVRTGLKRATSCKVLIADDDVRYDEDGFLAVVEELQRSDLVRPQNYFEPLPWHAAWDSARSLLNRAVGHDHPGTMGVDRLAYLRAGGYDGDVLFENLQLARTIEAAGGTVTDRLDVFVRRLPPTTGRFLSQRVRQAYDDLAEPRRLLFHLSIVPSLVWLTRRWGWPAPALAACASVGVAELGRRRASFSSRVPAKCSMCAPLWLMERATCVWVAIALRLMGGCPYAGIRIKRAAESPRRLRARLGRALGRIDDSRHTPARSSIGHSGIGRSPLVPGTPAGRTHQG